jgi:hypothetical protein
MIAGYTCVTVVLVPIISHEYNSYIIHNAENFGTLVYCSQI